MIGVPIEILDEFVTSLRVDQIVVSVGVANELEQDNTELLNSLCIQNNVNMIQTTPSRFHNYLESKNVKTNSGNRYDYFIF